MPNSSGFVDFNQYAALNQDEEQRLMEEAMARAEAADQSAQQQLVRTSQEAVNTGAQNIDRVASYSDYLKAKRSAADAWAAVGAEGADPRSAALHGAMRARNGINDRAAASAAELSGREGRLGERVGEAWVGAQKGKADRAAYAEAQAKAKEDRQKADAENKRNYFNSLFGRFADIKNLSGGPRGVAASDRIGWARQLSSGMDAGDWSLDSYAESTGGGFNPANKRGTWGSAIEQQAWGAPAQPGNRAKTRKGKWY